MRLFTGFAVAAIFTAAWVAIACLVMLVALYIVRAIPLTGRLGRRRIVSPEPPTRSAPVSAPPASSSSIIS